MQYHDGLRSRELGQAPMLQVFPGRGASDKRSAVGFCLGSGLFGSYNSD